MLLAVEESRASEVEDLLTRQKAFLKSWLIGYLSDQTLKDVERSVVNRQVGEGRPHGHEIDDVGAGRSPDRWHSSLRSLTAPDRRRRYAGAGCVGVQNIVLHQGARAAAKRTSARRSAPAVPSAMRPTRARSENRNVPR